MKDFNKILKHKVKSLPGHEPRPDAWETIASQIGFRNKLGKKIQELPENVPSEKIWENLSRELNKFKFSYKVTNTRKLIIGLSAAASVALIVGIYFLNRSGKQGTITLSEEIVDEWGTTTIMVNDTSTQDAIQFIEEHCRNKTYVCEMPGFDEKKKQLLEVNDQIKEIDRIMKSTGSSTTIIRSRIKLENMRTKLVKDLLTQIAS